MYKHFIGCCLLFSTALLVAQPSNFLHIDQFGYAPDAEKVAVLSDPQQGFNASNSYTPAISIQVRDSDTEAVVFSGNPVTFNDGQTDEASGDRGWWFDFSEFNMPGSYYLYDATNNERSAVFEIKDNPYHDVLKAAGRMYFYNRCNDAKEAPYAEADWTDGNNFLNPLQDANCRYIYDPGNAALEKDLSGGWFDAGDYNKYVTFTEETLHNLLAAYEENPGAFGDNWNIPESNNGLADLLDEVKWELDWLLKMINTDGSVHIKMGSSNFSENIASPPSANTDQRYYGPTCTSASAASASVLAHAALVFQDQDGYQAYSNTLRDQAINTYNYTLGRFNNNDLETDCDDGSIIAGDADRNANKQLESLVAAAVYLYALTNDTEYNQFFQQQYANTTPLTNNFWGGDQLFVQDALIDYLGLANGTPDVQQAIRTSITNAVNGNWNGFFGWLENDLYRSFVPSWTYYWGSNRPKANYGALNFKIAANDLGNEISSYQRKATEQIHYFHGVNPLGMVMLSNMYGLGGDRCVNEIYHTWFYDGTEYDNALTSSKGPAPGYVTGGPNANFSVTDLSPPANQPAQKSYLDFNDGWPLSSWEITEPAIYYQASYIRLLAHFVTAEEIVSTDTPPARQYVKAFPNPVLDQVYVQLPPGNYTVQILDTQGKLLNSISHQAGTSIDLSSLPSGSYLIEALSTSDENSYQVKLVKQ